MNVEDFAAAIPVRAPFSLHPPVDRLHTTDKTRLRNREIRLTKKIGVIKP
jgi:hypothetical protein